MAQSCPTLCDPTDCNTPGLPIHHQLPESAESVMPSNHLVLCRPLLLPSIFPSIRVFQMSQLFISGGQSIGVSASTSVLPMNIQDRFPLGWTGLISLQSKGLSRVFSNTTPVSISQLRFLHVDFIPRQNFPSESPIVASVLYLHN